MIGLKDAYKFSIFPPIVKSYRYEYMEKLFKAEQISHHYPEWLADKIDNNLKQGITGTQLVKKVLYETGIAIRTKTINRRQKN